MNRKQVIKHAAGIIDDREILARPPYEDRLASALAARAKQQGPTPGQRHAAAARPHLVPA